MQAHPGWGVEWSSERLERLERPVPPRSVRRQRRTRRRRTRRGLLTALAGAVAMLVAVSGWVALDALRARDALTVAADDLGAVRAALAAGDREGAAEALAAARAAVERAVDAVDGPDWAAAGWAPVVGDDVRAVRVLVEVLDDLTGDAFPLMVEALGDVDARTLLSGGAVDLAALRAAAPDVLAADAVVESAVERLGGIDSETLLAPVSDALIELRTGLAQVADATATTARLVRSVPGMVGGDGPRSYLLLVQNNAEPRATGGVPGAVAVLHADAGVLTLSDVTAAADVVVEQPVATLQPAEQALFGDLLATDMRDVTFTPDFPRAAELAAALWAQTGHTPVDGVLAVDPGALAALLEVVGPVSVAGPPGLPELVLSSDDVVDVLLNGVYQQVGDPAAQDALFASAAQAVVVALADGRGDPARVVRALAGAAGRGRVLLWSSHPDEQADLSGTSLAGELVGARSDVDGDRPVIGVYLNATAPSKMGYYLDLDEQVVARTCRPDGSQVLTLEVAATSTAPVDLSGLSTYVTGTAESGRAGQIAVNVLVYAPTDGRILRQWVDGQPAPTFAQIHDELQVAAQSIALAPGESSTLRYEVLTGPGQPGSPVVRTTPTAADGDAVGVPTCAG